MERSSLKSDAVPARARGFALLCALWSVSALLPVPASAQTGGASVARATEPDLAASPPAGDPAPETQGAYHDVVRHAIVEFEAKRFAEARALFLHAHELWPSARTLRTLGMTAFELRMYSRALEELQAALDDLRRPLDAEQRSQVLALVERTRAFVGRYRVQLSPPEAELLVDGAPWSTAQGPLVLAVGDHTLIARAKGYGELRRALVVQGREDEPLVLSLEPLAASARPAPLLPTAGASEPSAAPSTAPSRSVGTAVAPAPALGNDARTRSGPSRVAAWTAFGVGAAGFVGGGVFAVLALDHRSDLGPSKCPNQRCPPRFRAEEDEMKRFADFATAGFAFGVVGVALGTFLWLSGDAAASDADHAARARLRIGVGSASFAARF